MLIRTDCDIRRRYRSFLAAVVVAALWIGDLRSQPAADLLLVGGFVHDGSGQPPGRQDVGVVGERISFVGDAAAAGLNAAVVVDVDGLMVTPGFIDMHSHAELTEDYGEDALPFLHQGHHHGGDRGGRWGYARHRRAVRRARGPHRGERSFRDKGR